LAVYKESNDIFAYCLSSIPVQKRREEKLKNQQCISTSGAGVIAKHL